MPKGEASQLRIAVECHTCFDWLMPAMDDFRPLAQGWELDIVSGFHAGQWACCSAAVPTLAVVSAPEDETAVRYHPLFGYEMVARAGARPSAGWQTTTERHDFARET